MLLNLKKVFDAVNISYFLQNSFIMEEEFQLVSQLFIEPPTFYLFYWAIFTLLNANYVVLQINLFVLIVFIVYINDMVES